MTKKFAILDFWWSMMVNNLFCTILLFFISKLNNLFVGFQNTQWERANLRIVNHILRQKVSHPLTWALKWCSKKASSDISQKETPKMQIHKQNGMKSALFCFVGHLKKFKTVQTLKIYFFNFWYFNLNQLSSRSVQIRALSLIRQVFPFRGEHPNYRNDKVSNPPLS